MPARVTTGSTETPTRAVKESLALAAILVGITVSCGGGSGSGIDSDAGGEGGGPGGGSSSSSGSSGGSGSSGNSGSSSGSGSGSGSGGAADAGSMMGDAQTTADGSAGADTCPSTSHFCGLHVVRGTGGAPGHIVDTTGAVVQIHGVNIGGTEYMCTSGSVFKDYTPGQAAIATLKRYNVNAVRVLLNEQCWLGVNGLPTITGGAAQYRQQITDFVHLLTQNGLIAILDLHVAAPGTLQATSFEIQMTDTDHSPTFWGQVATSFKNDSAVIFDLYNEPNGNLSWSCWKGGCMLTTACVAGTCAAVPYQVAGMQSLVTAVRNAGAQNVVMMAGLGFSADFSQWAANVPSDPNVVASWHMYDDIIGCPSCPTAMQTEQAGSIASVLSAGYPVIFSETGISAAASPSAVSKTWLNGILSLLESQGQGYTAYEWGIPGDNPALLATVSSDGATVTLTAYGTAYTGHVAGLP